MSESKYSIFSKIHNRNDALGVIKATSMAMGWLAVFYTGKLLVEFSQSGSQEFYSETFVYFIILVIGSSLLQKYNSRLVALLVFLPAIWDILIIAIFLSVQYAKGHVVSLEDSDSIRIVYDFCALWIGIRGIEAAFKLHGRFALNEKSPNLIRGQ